MSTNPTRDAQLHWTRVVALLAALLFAIALLAWSADDPLTAPFAIVGLILASMAVWSYIQIRREDRRQP